MVVVIYITKAISKKSPLLIVVTLGQQYNVGEKPTVILYTCYLPSHSVNMKDQTWINKNKIKRRSRAAQLMRAL